MSATVNEKILNALNMYNEGLQEKISENYVEKELGKGLSTNDFTDADKAKGSVADSSFLPTNATGITLGGKDFSIDEFACHHCESIGSRMEGYFFGKNKTPLFTAGTFFCANLLKIRLR